MKNFAFIILLLGSVTPVHAGEKIDKSIDVPAAAIEVSIEDPHGQIDIQGWETAAVKVTGEISDQAQGYTFKKKGGKVTFKVKYPGQSNWRELFKRKDSSNLKFYMPAKSHLYAQNVSGDITVVGIKGGTSMKSVNGNIKAENLLQRASLETVNGNIITNHLQGRIDIQTVNGNVTDKASSGKLDLNSVQGNVYSSSHYTAVNVEIVNGNLELKLDKIDELTIDSVNGKIETSLNLNENGEVSISSVSGSIDLLFNRDVSADFTLEAVVGGTILNKLTADKPAKKKYGPGSSLIFSKNGGSGSVDINTVNGRIQIGKKE